MKVVLRIEPYDPDARDADGDGIIQEGTAWERPAGTRLISEVGQEIARGLTSTARPQMRIIDSNGNPVKYTPRYDSPSAPSPLRSVARPGAKLRSLADMGVPTVGQILASRRQTAPSAPQISEPEVAPVIEAIDKFARAADSKNVFRKFGNRDRSWRKADVRAQEVAFTGGKHYLLETDNQFVILPEGEYRSLVDKFGEDELRKTVTVFPYERPKADVAQDADVRDSLTGVKDINIDDDKYRDAVVDIHYNGGSVDDLPDDVFAAAMFDESLTYAGDELVMDDGSPVTFESILSGEYRADENFTFENRRFRITQIKDEFFEGAMLGGMWRVYKFTDKDTGAQWYVKASTYGANEGMLEDVGMRAGNLLDLAARPDTKHIRISPEIQCKAPFTDGKKEIPSNRQVRWIAMRSVDDWQNPTGQSLSWLDASAGGGIDPDTVNVEDLAQILAMDYILDNSDRHGGNIMVGIDADGTQRLAIIDNGLLMGGRAYADTGAYDEQITPDKIQLVAQRRAQMTGTDIVGDALNNYLIRDPKVIAMADRLSDYFGDDADGQKFLTAQQEVVARLKENLDSLLDPKAFADRGIPLSATEIAHLKAMKMVASMRIEMIESYPEMLLDAIAMQRT